MVPVEISRLVIHEGSDEQLIHLRESGEGRILPLIIGMSEAAALDRILKQRTLPRPMTHDLFVTALERLQAAVVRAVIDDLRDETYFAKLVLRQQGQELYLDARPSDAIILALLTQAPLFVADRVMNAMGEMS